jgi:hypothetical protein
MITILIYDKLNVFVGFQNKLMEFLKILFTILNHILAQHFVFVINLCVLKYVEVCF